MTYGRISAFSRRDFVRRTAAAGGQFPKFLWDATLLGPEERSIVLAIDWTYTNRTNADRVGLPLG
jgi:hypothetical protein